MRLGVDAWLKRWSDCDMVFRVLIRKCEIRERDSLEQRQAESCECLSVCS